MEDPTTPFLEGRKLSTIPTLDNASCSSHIRHTGANTPPGAEKIEGDKAGDHSVRLSCRQSSLKRLTCSLPSSAMGNAVLL